MPLMRRMVLDVLKPLSPSIIDLASRICGVSGVDSVECTIMEIDRDTESVKVTVQGPNIKYPQVEAVITNFGAVVHSVDSVTTARKASRPRRSRPAEGSDAPSEHPKKL